MNQKGKLSPKLKSILQPQISYLQYQLKLYLKLIVDLIIQKANYNLFMNQNNEKFQQKLKIAEKILKHLNTRCSFGAVFVIISTSTLLIQINSLQNNNQKFDKDLMLQITIDSLYKAFPKFCQKQIQQVNKIQGQFIPNSFLLQISIDQITKQQLQWPFKAINKDKLILCPLFIDFQALLEKIAESQNQQEEIENIDADEYYIILLMWNIRILLNENYSRQASKISFELIIYPKQYNFGICKNQNNLEVIHFISNAHQQQFLKQNSLFHKQSTRISEALKEKKLTEYSVKLFQRKQNNLENQKSTEKTNIYSKYVLIPQCPLNIQSTLCLNDDIEHNLQHFIEYKKNENPKCQCGREIDPYSCDTLIIDHKLTEALEKIILDLCLQQNYSLENIDANLLYVEMVQDKYQNYFIQLFYKQENQKEYLRKHFFEEQIKDREDNLDQLLYGSEEINYALVEQLKEEEQSKEDEQLKQVEQSNQFGQLKVVEKLKEEQRTNNNFQQ